MVQNSKHCPALVMRIDLPGGHRLGRGKISLLELIKFHGSISAAGRAMDMSYRRAWLLVDEMNRMFASPVVTTQRGGSHGGKAVVTELGEELVARFRQMERNASKSIKANLDWLETSLRTEPATKEERTG